MNAASALPAETHSVTISPLFDARWQRFARAV